PFILTSSQQLTRSATTLSRCQPSRLQPHRCYLSPPESLPLHHHCFSTEPATVATLRLVMPPPMPLWFCPLPTPPPLFSTNHHYCSVVSAPTQLHEAV
ncbi:UNVERIFIED_CONTAM: hypothetical protein Sradi_6431300, partial [Sesamum radiatum]